MSAAFIISDPEVLVEVIHIDTETLEFVLGGVDLLLNPEQLAVQPRQLVGVLLDPLLRVQGQAEIPYVVPPDSHPPDGLWRLGVCHQDRRREHGRVVDAGGRPAVVAELGLVVTSGHGISVFRMREAGHQTQA